MTLDGEVKGDHSGLMYYTIGQRQGLGIGGGGDSNEPWFVICRNTETQTLLLVKDIIMKTYNLIILEASDLSFTNSLPVDGTFECTAKFRYRGQDVEVKVEIDAEANFATVYFKEPVRAITPGQAVVFYDGDECLGGGTIDTAFSNSQKRQYV